MADDGPLGNGDVLQRMAKKIVVNAGIENRSCTGLNHFSKRIGKSVLNHCASEEQITITFSSKVRECTPLSLTSEPKN